MNQRSKNSNANVLGCPITKLGLQDFVQSAENFISSGKPHYIAVVNVAKVIKMRSDPFLDESVRSADLIGADGVPLVWASRLLGDSLPGRVNGTDLMYSLMAKANEKGYRIFFFGAKQEVLDKVVETVRRRYPGIQIAGFHHGYFSSSEEWDIVQQIRAAQADILFIAFDTPKKELWVKRYLAEMNVSVVHGVGGSFDVFAGVIPRAPLWMQRGGLEWFFRMCQEPRRMWRRYLITNTVFVVILMKEWVRYHIGLPPQTLDRY
jgi:N-acetylglucosaminyldiphosphoundecaprenol N-acetyl-beta-D-mannosaminyltransferase